MQMPDLLQHLLGMGKIATVGLASVIFGTMMNVTGSSLASWWHNRPPEDEPPERELS
jgi:BASS family bile acid:Na+ symporter